MSTPADALAAVTSGTQHREIPATRVQIREDQADRPGFVGIAVPFDVETEIYPGLRESVAPAAVTQHDQFLFWRHREPIGTYTARDTPPGWEIAAVISDTTQGRDATVLMRDAAAAGVPFGLSIGFDPITWETSVDDTGTTHIRHTSIRVREVSMTPHPAYDPAAITSTREKETMTNPTPPTTEAADLDALTRELADLRRSFATLDVREAAPAVDQRSAGQLLYLAARGDSDAVAALNRAYEGGTTKDDFGTHRWIGDLTRLIDQADPLDGLFATAPLPDTGMTLEYGQLKANTLKAAKQANEGDTIVQGKIAVESKNVPVETWAGGSKLSIQQIKRAQAPMLDLTLRGLAIETGKARASAVRTALNSAIAASETATNTVAMGTGETWRAWINPLVAAVKKMRALGVGLSGLLLPEAVWIEIAQWADTNDRPILTPSATAADVGTFSITNLDGTLLHVPTRMIDIAKPVFFNRDALRVFTDPAARLTDTEVFSLVEDVAVYQFGAVAPEIPGAIIPVATAPTGA